MAGIIYLGVLLLAPSCSLPGRQMGRAAPSPCLALLLVWFAWPATLLPPPVVSYTAVSPSPIVSSAKNASKQFRQYSSLLHLPSGHPARLLAGTMPYGVRTFLSERFHWKRQPRSPSQLDAMIVAGSDGVCKLLGDTIRKQSTINN